MLEALIATAIAACGAHPVAAGSAGAGAAALVLLPVGIFRARKSRAKPEEPGDPMEWVGGEAIVSFGPFGHPADSENPDERLAR